MVDARNAARAREWEVAYGRAPGGYRCHVDTQRVGHHLHAGLAHRVAEGLVVPVRAHRERIAQRRLPVDTHVDESSGRRAASLFAAAQVAHSHNTPELGASLGSGHCRAERS